MAGDKAAVVAVVDDDWTVVESLADLLASVGYGTAPFTTAHELLQSTDLDHIDCLISDIRMPGMDGWALYLELQQRHPRIPVILITAHDSPSDIQRSSRLSNGSLQLLRKPFDAQQLLTAVQRAMQSPA